MNTDINRLTEEIIGAAIEVHRELGPGLLESAYEAALVYEFTLRNLRFERQKEQPVRYKGLLIETGFRIDILVDGRVVLELKAVDGVLPIHEAQLITYLKLSGCKVGLLINFNVPLLKQGITRLVV
jgi:GxxExxY protein